MASVHVSMYILCICVYVCTILIVYNTCNNNNNSNNNNNIITIRIIGYDAWLLEDHKAQRETAYSLQSHMNAEIFNEAVADG